MSKLPLFMKILTRKTYLQQLEGFEVKGEEDHVCLLKQKLSKEFEKKDLGGAKKILGMEI